MKYENLWLSGNCIKKKMPVPYDFGGRKGTTYSIFLDSGENVYELKVPETVYNVMSIGSKYMLDCQCIIDRSNKDNNSFSVRSIVKECGADDDFTLSLLSELNSSKPSGKGKTDSNTQPETKQTPQK